VSILVSVVIPTYNRLDLLSLCLKSLLNQTADPDSYELVVADDGSTDDTPEFMKKIAHSAACPINYLWHENFGRSKNRNLGIKAAQGKYLILLDCDMVVRPTFIISHLEKHTTSKLIVHGAVINTPNIPNPEAVPEKFRDLSRAFFATGNVSLEREWLLQAGLFDEDFIEYGWEDLELGERLCALGLKAVKAPTACSLHFNPPFTYEGISNLIAKEKERGHTAVLFYRKRPTLSVKLMTLISPVFFFFDFLTTLFHWTEHPNTYKLLKKLNQNGSEFLFNLLIAIIKNHAYADGLREALAKDQVT